MRLFRSEVSERKQDENTFGDVVLIRPISFTIYTTIFVVFVISLGLFLFFGHYANKETVKGVVNPQSGLVKVYAPQRGVVYPARLMKGTRLTRVM